MRNNELLGQFILLISSAIVCITSLKIPPSYIYVNPNSLKVSELPNSSAWMYLTWLKTYDLDTLEIMIPTHYKSVQVTWDVKKFKRANIVEYAYLGYI
jgi:hypothetical protein